MLRKFIQKGGVIIDPEVKKKEELFALIAKDALEKDLIKNDVEFVKELMNREEQMSTEIESGVAIPHAKTDIVKNGFVYCITSEKGIKFSGLTSKVKVIFLIGVPKQAKHYLDIMAIIARLLQKKEFCANLMESKDKNDVIEHISSYLTAEDTSKLGQKNLFALYLVLNETENVETAMELAVEIGMKSIQVFDTTNAAAKIAYNFPFVSFFSSKNETISSKTLFGIVENETIINRFYAHLKKEGIDVLNPGVGSLFSLPVVTMFGGVEKDYF